MNTPLVDTLIELYAVTDASRSPSSTDLWNRFIDIRFLVYSLIQRTCYPADDIRNLVELADTVYRCYLAVFERETFDPYGLNARKNTKRKVYNG